MNEFTVLMKWEIFDPIIELSRFGERVCVCVRALYEVLISDEFV